MSLSGSLNAAVAGLQAQSRALGLISDNVANSQTVGYKRVESRFSTLVTVSNSSLHSPGGVRQSPFRATDLQGTITSTSSITNLALSGNGFFSASKVRGEQDGLPIFEIDPVFTRAGDFTIDKDGYMVNTGGYYLNAWSVAEQNGRRITDRTTVEPMRVSQLRDAPTATSIIQYGANLPASSKIADDFDTNPVTAPPRNVSAVGDPIDLSPTQVKIYDALGAPHTLDLAWSRPTTITTDAAGNTTTVPGELNSDQGNPYINENVWYVTMDGNDFSFAPTVGTDQVTTSVNKVQYRVEFYAENTTVNGQAVLAGSIKSLTELQGGSANSMLAEALKLASFDGTNFQNIPSTAGVTLSAINTVATPNQPFGTPVAGVEFGPAAINTVDVDPNARTVSLNFDGTAANTFTGAIPVNSAGETAGPIILTDPAGNTIVANVPDGIRLTDLGSVIESLTNTGAFQYDSNTASPPAGTFSGFLQGIDPAQLGSNVLTATDSVPSFAPGTARLINFDASTGNVSINVEGRIFSGTIPTAAGVTTGAAYTLTETTLPTPAVPATITFGATASPAGIPMAAYQRFIEGALTELSHDGNGAFSFASNLVDFQQATTTPQFAAGEMSTNYIRQDGATSFTIDGQEYVGKFELDVTGRIANTAGTPDPVTLVAADGTAVRIQFDNAWDLDGVELPNTANSLAELPLNIIFANPGADLIAGNLPDEVSETVNIQLGRYGVADGLTHYAGESIDFLRTNQDGVPPGSFRDLTIDELGYVTVNYDNGRRKTFFQIPVALFDNSNALQAVAGNGFTATFDSGEAAYTNAGGSGAGSISSSSLEGSNVDIADEFSKLIITQRSYSANARLVTTADGMLEETVNLVR